MVKTLQRNKWIGAADYNPGAALRFFCFPYAGGGSAVFRGWEKEVPQSVGVCPIELPGRGKRIGESAFTHITPLVEAAAEALLPYFDKPFAFFGHSMGAKIAFELSRLLHKRHGLNPVHLFLSGSSAPQIPNTQPISYSLPLTEFIREVQNLNGTPSEVLEHTELLELIIPSLRADFEVVQTYTYVEGLPLTCPIKLFGGLQDKQIPIDHLKAWATQTSSAFSLSMLPGDHFFINSSRPALLQILKSDLERLVK